MEVFNTRYQNKSQLYNFIEDHNISDSDNLLIQMLRRTERINFVFIKFAFRKKRLLRREGNYGFGL